MKYGASWIHCHFVLVLRRFERVPASKLSISTDKAEMVRSETIEGEPISALWQCVAGKEDFAFPLCKKKGGSGVLELESRWMLVLLRSRTSRDKQEFWDISF